MSLDIIALFFSDGRKVKDVALGSEHTICLATDNTLWAWGWNEHSNTGIQSETDIFLPTLVPIPRSGTITHIFAGGAHNFIVADGKVIEPDDKMVDSESFISIDEN